MPEAPDNKCPYCDGAGTPVAWQWRRTDQQWNLWQTSNFPLKASEGTQVRPLYAGPAIDSRFAAAHYQDGRDLKEQAHG